MKTRRQNGHRHSAWRNAGLLLLTSLVLAGLTKIVTGTEPAGARHDTPAQAIAGTSLAIDHIEPDGMAPVTQDFIVVAFRCTIRDSHTIQHLRQDMPGTGVALLRKHSDGYSLEEINVGTKDVVIHPFELILDAQTGSRQTVLAAYSPTGPEPKVRVTGAEP